MKNTLQVTTPSDEEIALIRVFDAPRKLVFEAWTRPGLVRRWLTGPDGWAMVVCEIDCKVGGTYRYVWRNDDGRQMGMRGIYREIVRPERLVVTEKFDDPWYEGEAVVTMTFAEQGGKTTLTETVRYASKKIRDGVLESGMESGVAASFDRLERLLESQAR
jgi:uncharacterized protein YndB with AHSA1/START domain